MCVFFVFLWAAVGSDVCLSVVDGADVHVSLSVVCRCGCGYGYAATGSGGCGFVVVGASVQLSVCRCVSLCLYVSL